LIFETRKLDNFQICNEEAESLASVFAGFSIQSRISIPIVSATVSATLLKHHGKDKQIKKPHGRKRVGGVQLHVQFHDHHPLVCRCHYST
tara:strand:- start:322 stop:591 length:270 start_codon:yes stop_codon:yes gene_type:complete